MKRTIAITAAALLMLAACDSPKTATPTTEATASPHAPEGAAPGSHEDWCGEHQVPESMCTRCNSSLIAGFKATGDWCDEHSVPKSQCLTCDPNLKIDRPPKEGTL